ncbi:DNA-binding LytR/AlgR family response regulator [Dyadobacter sp. BE34]|uniref:DNA-binding LytR/AlgR family response regulator n=1 Tax=Dyadobacter fermentans TaxID=94254 RepID=A0ABU1R880_9BACT|nr:MULTISPECIES: LytTR family DNA-binding domain-containing protein [Dyadobacter]MDR6809598.1 DNA-binding LytR/AlgR family response regulator [Dyadobacter fermentans]MDR7047276.1 DNA-binding LytR/AlgR family response regulator [Dyadobacter sp. BE242]MDR7201512.1 DNA-binding LytR/AlgR family response regulator [Dyadobacter sp. BE34]MDR7219382.1 DNA-binding LytR/AlgR family response regulator [Dyadobacter sp. BE31]MDR7267224.1 DNA-binding LytR/AlgR family response regulator [Dyadobacter sp. BE32
MKITCMIIDDETLARKLLTDYVSKIPSLDLVATCANAIEAWAVLKSRRVDLLFLDVQMPDINGISFMQTLGKSQLTVFTTAYTEYAVKSYELDALDYLVKPIAFERFFQAVGKAMDRLGTRNTIRQNVLADIEQDYIFIKSDAKTYKVTLGDIDYLEAYGEYVLIHRSADRLMTLMQLGKMEEILPASQFMRVHRSFIIQFSKIDAIQGNSIWIGKKEIPVSRTYREALIQRVQQRNLSGNPDL